MTVGGMMCQHWFTEHPIRLKFISCFLFSQWPRNGQKVPLFGVSVGCLQGVCVMSGWSGSHLGYFHG